MPRLVGLALVVVAVFLVQSAAAVSILKFGAVANSTAIDVCFKNSAAIHNAIVAANSSTSDRTAVVPAGMTFCIIDVKPLSYLRSLTLSIQGTLVLTNNMTAWPTKGPDAVGAAFTLSNCENLTINGGGTVDGQGYDWWWSVFLTHVDNRPNLFNLDSCKDTIITDITARNSPQFHFSLGDMLNLYVARVTVRVDVIAQKRMMEAAGHMMHVDGLPFPIPVFPLNTDGIDIAGRNVLVEDCSIENFDDAVAVKPIGVGSGLVQCSSNMVIRNTQVSWGVGMSIGSIGPSTNHPCVRNITFDNIEFNHPIKAIYIKTDPGTTGDGVVEDITYRNIVAHMPLWYPIWIGPQQEQQPGSKGKGCSFLYPIVDKCPTQPRITINNIKLENVTMLQGVTLPGVLLCNETHPCTNYSFEDVTNTGYFLVQKDYVCQNVANSTSSGTSPPPPCFGASSGARDAQSHPGVLEEVKAKLEVELDRLRANSEWDWPAAA